MFLLYETERLSWSSRLYAAKHVSSCAVVVVVRAAAGSSGSALVFLRWVGIDIFHSFGFSIEFYEFFRIKKPFISYIEFHLKKLQNQIITPNRNPNKTNHN